MPLELSAAQVQALAPDAASAAAGKKLGKPGTWKNLGQSDAALWGECQGSALYQTQVALVDLAAKCTCPSRKFPCKHALGLLLLAVDAPAAVVAAAEPEWVAGWLAKRGATQERKAAAPKPVDEAAQAKRAQKRHDNVLAGLEQLDGWLHDLVRQGLARVQAEGPQLWETQARRMVDAQAPGVAARLRRASERVGVGEDWAVHTLHELGVLALLTHAYRRVDALDAPLAADVRRLIGYALEQSEVLAHGDVVEDDWTVLAEQTGDEDRVRMQRVWLHGARSDRRATIVHFAAGPNARFPELLIPATRFRGRLAFWPSACPQRALIVERHPAANAEAPSGTTIASALDRYAASLAKLPWLERELFVLDRVVPVQVDPGHVALDAEDHGLPLAGRDHDVLLAISGGHPLTLVAEWDGYGLWPQVAWQDGRMFALRRA